MARAQQLARAGQASTGLLQVYAGVARSLAMICSHFMEVESYTGIDKQTKAVEDLLTRAGLRRRRKRSTRSRKSKAGKNGRVRQSGKKSKRGRKSPVGNPKRRPHTEAGSSSQNKRKPAMYDSNGKKCRTVTAPPTDSMKFGPCRDFFLSHLGDPYPTTVQKHQILKVSSPDFTLRSLNLWFVNIRRRSKWMDIFKKHAGSKRDAMRDLVARVEAQVAGRPAPNPLPSGATPPGLKVEQEIVDEVMTMRAVVDMVSREVYGEGWDQILQIKPWTDEEVRAHEERKKASRREARASKADGEKRKREREEQRERRKRDRESRKRVEQEAVDGIRAARELHAKLMAMNKRKRDDGDDGSEAGAKRHRKGGEVVVVDENGQPKQRKIRVPKFDDQGNPLTKEQRKAIKKAILASQAQVNPLKRKASEHSAPGDHLGELPNFPEDVSPSKRRRRDAVTFDGFPTSEETTEAGGIVDLSQLFSVGWASPPREPEPLPPVEAPASPVSNPGYNEFAHPSDSQMPMAPPMQMEQSAPAPTSGEVPRRFSQQLAAYALESGMFDGESFELFTEDTFPGMAVDVNADNSMGSLLPPAPHHQGASMSVSPAQTAQHTPMPPFTAPIQTQQYDSFAPAQQHGHTPPSPYSTASTITPTNGDADSDMSWINAALAQLPSEHDAPHQMHQQYAHAPAPQHQMQHPTPQPSFTPTYASDPNPYGSHSFPAASDRRAPVSHQRTPLPFPAPQSQNSMPPPPAPSTSPSQPRRSFPQPQARPPAPQQVFQSPPQPQPQPQQRQRAPRELWQTPYSQPAQQQQYQPPPPSFSAPSPTLSQSSSRSFPAPAPQQHSNQPQYSEPSYERRNAYSHPSPSSPERVPGHEQEYQHAPIYPPPQHQQPQYSHPSTPAPQPAPSPVSNTSDILKQHELEFARAQEELQNRFKREQEEQLARFMRAQEDLRKQLLTDSRAEHR
ncbi:hypothetical protein BDV93DRAFT_522898 [Ceratobasidium sp. AG-I]|nr:hypothetical protein BDV93DRAFT_522898 [Ceratobasidium sp. AG-I]